MKPGITFYGENLPKRFFECLKTDEVKADLVLIIGTSMKVHPVCLVPDQVEPHVPRVLINLEKVGERDLDAFYLDNLNDRPLGLHFDPDGEFVDTFMRGESDIITRNIMDALNK